MDFVVKDASDFHQTETNANLLYLCIVSTACGGALAMKRRDGHNLKLFAFKQRQHLVSLVYKRSAPKTLSVHSTPAPSN